MTHRGIWDRYRRYLATPPELVIEWHDRPTDARGWLVINSLRGGAAGGGTRMRDGVTREEVVYLAKAMELKFTFSGPHIGGGKSGIDFDPGDPRRREVLERWFAAMRPWLSTCYGTGGDVNVDELRDVVPLCTGLGLAHPQIGILTGHLKTAEDDAAQALESLRVGLALPLAGTEFGVGTTPLTVSDMITGWAVAHAAGRLLAGGGRLDGLRATIEGFGNVGGSAALYLARAGARIVAITDAAHVLVTPRGLDAESIERLIAARDDRALPEHPDRRDGTHRNVAYETPTDLAIPAAVSGSLDVERLQRLQSAGAVAIVCGANQPFAEASLGDTRTQEWVDGRFTVLADVVGSMGMARALDHLMKGGAHRTPGDVFDAVRSGVDTAVEAVIAHHAALSNGAASGAAASGAAGPDRAAGANGANPAGSTGFLASALALAMDHSAVV